MKKKSESLLKKSEFDSFSVNHASKEWSLGSL